MSCDQAERLLQTLRTQIPGVTDDMLNLQLFNVIDEFFRRTNAWQHYDDIPLQENIQQYVIPVPSGAVIVRAMGASHNGMPITFQMSPPDLVWLFHQPDLPMIEHPVVMGVSLSVAKDCMAKSCDCWEIPEWCWNSFFQAWLDGVLARFYSMPAKPWSNSAQAVYHHKRFRNLMGGHKQEAEKGFVHSLPGWNFPRVGGWM